MILLIGSSGYIGNSIKLELTKRKIDFISKSYYTIFDNSISIHQNRDNLKKIILDNKISIIINSAAYVGNPNTDVCELNKVDTLRGNVELPLFLKDVCLECGIVFGHVSSGCIYNGYEKEYTEDDDPNFTFKYNNCSYYSGTKALAEENIKLYEKSYIWRIRLPFDNISSHRNYINKVIKYDRLLNLKNSVSNREEFATACIDSIILKIPYGIYNIVNTGAVDAEYVSKMITKYLNINKEFKFINEIEFRDTISSVPKSNCILSNSKMKYCGLKIKNANDSIEHSLKNWIYND